MDVCLEGGERGEWSEGGLGLETDRGEEGSWEGAGGIVFGWVVVKAVNGGLLRNRLYGSFFNGMQEKHAKRTVLHRFSCLGIREVC